MGQENKGLGVVASPPGHSDEPASGLAAVAGSVPNAWDALSAQTGCNEKLVYEIGKRVADGSSYRAGSDNHTRVWLAAQLGAREALRSTADLLEALEAILAEDNPTLTAMNERLEAGRAAIAKATGAA